MAVVAIFRPFCDIAVYKLSSFLWPIKYQKEWQTLNIFFIQAWFFILIVGFD